LHIELSTGLTKRYSIGALLHLLRALHRLTKLCRKHECSGTNCIFNPC